jgi:uncharacterized protein (TIGR03000 family)
MMFRRWLPAAALLAVAALLVQPGQAGAFHFLAYYPGGIVNWYHGDYDFVSGWQNHHWPSSTSYFTYSIGQGTYKVYYPTPDASGKYYYYTPKAGVPVQETTALIEVKLPASDADLWFEGVRTTGTGTVRQFLSPPLVIGRKYRYEILALWQEGRREVKQSRFVTVEAGDRKTVDFTQPPPK